MSFLTSAAVRAQPRLRHGGLDGAGREVDGIVGIAELTDGGADRGSAARSPKDQRDNNRPRSFVGIGISVPAAGVYTLALTRPITP